MFAGTKVQRSTVLHLLLGATCAADQVHMFDGLAMLSKVTFRGGKVTGMQRHLRTKQRR